MTSCSKRTMTSCKRSRKKTFRDWISTAHHYLHKPSKQNRTNIVTEDGGQPTTALLFSEFSFGLEPEGEPSAIKRWGAADTHIIYTPWQNNMDKQKQKNDFPNMWTLNLSIGKKNGPHGVDFFLHVKIKHCSAGAMLRKFYFLFLRFR